MALLISSATGNMTSAATWKQASSSTSSSTGDYLNVESNNGTVTAGSSLNSLSFTPGAITIDAIGIKFNTVPSGSNGTLTVGLYNVTDTIDVPGASVTVNASDIPVYAVANVAESGWHFFVFSSVTLEAGKSYAVRLSRSAGATGAITVCRDASSNNWTRILRTTTTAAPAAGDDLIVAGEYTGAGTSNSFVVTMDSTAATDYGSTQLASNSAMNPAIAVCNKGTFKYGTAASTNYVLRVSGSIVVYKNGVFNIGTAADPVPRSSTAVLEFDLTAADGEYGLIIRDGATWTSQGLSRTSGKNVVSCKLSGGGYNTTAGFSVNTTSGSPILTNVPTAMFGTFVVGDLIGQNNSTTIIPANTTVLGYRDSNGVNYGDTTGITANGQIRMSANALSTSLISGGCYTNAFVGSKLLTVDTDTGWLSGDMIALASTTQTQAECEVGKLTADAGVTQLSCNGFISASSTLPTSFPPSGTGGLLSIHDGVTPFQAEVINLTRNVVIRSTSSMLMAFVMIGHTTTASSAITVDVDWTEFYYLGNSTASKRGVEIAGITTGSSVTFHYCSFHDCEYTGVYLNVVSSNCTLVVSYCVFWNVMTGVSGQGAVTISTGVQSRNIEVSYCTIIRCVQGTSYGIFIGANANVFNNSVVGLGFGFAFGSSFSAGWSESVFAYNVAHSCSWGVTITTSPYSVRITNCVFYRNVTYGIGPGSSSIHIVLVVEDSQFYGHGTAAVVVEAPGGNIELYRCTFAGDTKHGQARGVSASSGTLAAMKVYVEDCDFGVATGRFVAHSVSDIHFIDVGNPMANPQVKVHNSRLASSNEVSGVIVPDGFVVSTKHDQTAGSHKAWYAGGIAQSDTVIYRAAAPSERLTPIIMFTGLSGVGVTSGSPAATITGTNASQIFNGWYILAGTPNAFPFSRISAFDGVGSFTLSQNATQTSASGSFSLYAPLKTALKAVPVNSGDTLTANVYVRESVAGDGTAYVGIKPRLMLKANPSMGITADTELDVAVGSAGSWELLSGAAPVAPRDGVYEFYVEVAGTAGWVNVDDWSATYVT